MLSYFYGTSTVYKEHTYTSKPRYRYIIFLLWKIREMGKKGGSITHLTVGRNKGQGLSNTTECGSWGVASKLR